MTKKLAALALTLLLPALASASDINPGALQLGGKTAFDWNLNTRDAGASQDTTKIGANLGAMYFVSHFLGFGLDVGYDHVKFDGGDYDSTFTFGPKAGIDWTLMEHFSVFADLTVGIARGETKDLAGNIDTGDGFGYGLSAGFRLFLNRNVSLDLFGAFDQVRLDFPTAGKVTSSNLTGGVGLSIYLTNNPANAQDYQPAPAPAPVYR